MQNPSCPDIQLLPKLAHIFSVTLDCLFERPERPAFQPEQAAVAGLPWDNDGDLRAVFYIGHTLRKHWRFPGMPGPKQVEFVYEGPAINVHSDFAITRKGDVTGNVCAGDGVNCGNVEGSIRAGDSIICGNVGGSAYAGDSIRSSCIGGDASAGDRIACDNIAGRTWNG